MIREPIYDGLLQSDLDFAGFKPLNADLSDYAIGGGGGSSLLTRYAGNPVINYDVATWKETQITSPVVFVDPTDATKLIMLFTGAADISSTGIAVANASDPYTWTECAANPFIFAADSQWTTSAVVVGTSVYVYTADFSDLVIDLYVSTNLTAANALAGTVTFTRTPAVLSPAGDETRLEYPAVIRDDATHWYMAYSYYTASETLRSIRIATSSNGISWTNGTTAVLTTGAAGSFDSRYIEGAQLLKINGTYVLCYDAWDGLAYPTVDPIGRWTLGQTYSSSPTTGYVKKELNPMFGGSEISGTPDRYYVSTPWWIEVNGIWYLYYQAASGDVTAINYINQNWPLCVATLEPGKSPLDFIIKGTLPAGGTIGQVLQKNSDTNYDASWGSTIPVGTDARLVPITGGAKLQARNPGTNTWADVDQWTNP